MKNMSVRFFIFDDEISDIKEVNESEFLECKHPIEYERHTVFQNGVSQICLTKIPEF